MNLKLPFAFALVIGTYGDTLLMEQPTTECNILFKVTSMVSGPLMT